MAFAAARRRRKKRLAEMEAEESAVDRLIEVMERLQERAGVSPRQRSDPRTGARPPIEPVKTKILVDDEFHTLH